jgi:hypothetical protein
MASEPMMPEEEAEHALANGTPRRQLSDEAKKIWDRLRAERDPGYQPYMRDVDVQASRVSPSATMACPA